MKLFWEYWKASYNDAMIFEYIGIIIAPICNSKISVENVKCNDFLNLLKIMENVKNLFTKTQMQAANNYSNYLFCLAGKSH